MSYNWKAERKRLEKSDVNFTYKYVRHFHSQQIENVYLSCGHLRRELWLGRHVVCGACAECLHKAAIVAQKVERDRAVEILKKHMAVLTTPAERKTFRMAIAEIEGKP